MNSSIWFSSSIIRSVIIAILLFSAIKLKASNWQLLLLGLLPTIIRYLRNADARVYSVHGFMHTSIVYQIMNGYIPPHSPILAGEPLQYPWAHHLMVAIMTYGLRISPPTAFAAINICALLLTLVLVFKIAVFLSSSRIAAILATVLSIFGLTFLNQGPIALFLAKLTSLNSLFEELPPSLVAPKFTTVNSMPLGILFFALFLHSILHIFSAQTRVPQYYATLVLSIIGAGFFYPMIWLVLPPICITICCVVYFHYRQAVWPKLTKTIICLLCGTLVVLPYLYQISSGKTEATLGLTPDFPFLLFKCVRYFLTILPISVVLFWKRKVLLHLLHAKQTATLILIVTTATTALMFIFFSILPAPNNDYKYLALSCLSLGIIASVSIEALYLKNKIICFFLMLSFMVPFNSPSRGNTVRLTKLRVEKSKESREIKAAVGEENKAYPNSIVSKEKVPNTSWKYSDPYVERGRYLYHGEQNEDALYRWISSQTESKAIFLDTHLTIPVFGRRQLYVGLDIRQKSLDKDVKNGWVKSVDAIWRTQAYSPKIIDTRQRVAREIYSKTSTQISKEVLLELNRASENGDVYIVARDENTNNKLANNTAFKKVFEVDGAAVYQVINEK